MNPMTPMNSAARPLAGGQAAGPGAPSKMGQASPRVTNFAQSMAADGAAMKNMGSGAMMSAPSQDSGYDMNRAFKLTSQKIGAGKTDGADLFAAALAEVGE